MKFTAAYTIPAKPPIDKIILDGKGNGILDPLGNATRAETASMLVRILDIIK